MTSPKAAAAAVRKVYKYATGQPIPEGAVYLSTQVEKQVFVNKHTEAADEILTERNVLVWHYFLVEV